MILVLGTDGLIYYRDPQTAEAASEPARAAADSKATAMYFCPILPCADKSYYVGVTDNPRQRLHLHNEGRGATWAAARRPVGLIWIERHPTLSAARQRVNQLKCWSRE